VAVPGMSALGGHLGADLDIHKQTRVAPPERDGGRWVLCSDSGEELGVFDTLVVSAPAPQTRELLVTVAPYFAEQAASLGSLLKVRWKVKSAPGDSRSPKRVRSARAWQNRSLPGQAAIRNQKSCDDVGKDGPVRTASAELH
jgi:hypothetical protein